MRISERNLIEMATAYIEDGVVKKWRFFSYDATNMNAILDRKQRTGELVTEGEVAYIKQFPNVVIANKHQVQFINFTGKATRY